MAQTTETCQNPPALSEDDLFSAIDGTAGAEVTRHLATCPHCARRRDGLAGELQALEGGLRSQMFRQGCPDAEALVDFAMGRLEGAAQTRIDLHASACLRCSIEIAWARRAFATEARPAQTASPPQQAAERFGERLSRQIQRIFATLMPTPPQFALRGGAETRAFSADFAGGQVFVELTPAAAGHLLTGQLIFDEDDRMWKGALVQVFVGDALTATTVTDEFLEFESDVRGEGPLTLSVTSEHGQQLQIQAGVAGIPPAARR